MKYIKFLSVILFSLTLLACNATKGSFNIYYNGVKHKAVEYRAIEEESKIKYTTPEGNKVSYQGSYEIYEE